MYLVQDQTTKRITTTNLTKKRKYRVGFVMIAIRNEQKETVVYFLDQSGRFQKVNNSILQVSQKQSKSKYKIAKVVNHKEFLEVVNAKKNSLIEELGESVEFYTKFVPSRLVRETTIIKVKCPKAPCIKTCVNLICFCVGDEQSGYKCEPQS